MTKFPPTKEIRNSVDYLDMLYRYFYLYPKFEEDQLDWIYSFSILAWHFCDWYYNDGILNYKNQDIKVIQNIFISECPELEVCGAIANGSKHRVLSDKRFKGFNLQTSLSTNGRMGIGKLGLAGKDNFDITLVPNIIIEYDGSKYESLVLFHRVLLFWRNKLQQVNII